MARHIFDFHFEHQTGSELFFIDRKSKVSEPEVRNIPDRKRIEFQLAFPRDSFRLRC